MFSFERDKKRVDVQTHMRRVADLTSPNLVPIQGGGRTEQRYNRTLPVLVAPYDNGEVYVEGGVLAVSKDLCDRGMSVIICESYPEAEVALGLWLCPQSVSQEETEPIFFVGQVRQCSEIGAGYWQAGIELMEVITSRKLLAELRPLARKLLPQNVQADAALA
jgi:hypothetical protein